MVTVVSEWTPEQVADIRNALAIIRNAVLDGDNVVHQQEHLNRYLTNHDSARVFMRRRQRCVRSGTSFCIR
jgi:hypothetical protein